MGASPPIKYVYIPADPAEGFEERVYNCAPGKDSCSDFLDKLKLHFKAATGGTDQATALKNHQQHLLQEAKKKNQHIPDNVLNMLKDFQMVETVPLVPNRPDTGFVAVNLYCDDSATFKQLPVNVRATQLAEACGLVMQIYGDVFVGRIFDNEDDFRRQDFTLAELSSSAPWVQRAKAINLQRSNRSGAMEQQWVDMQAAAQQQRSQQAGASTSGSSSSSSAEQEKLKGNTAFKKGDWQAALEHYTAALKLEPGMVAARNNRALAYLKLGMAQQAIDDCTAVLEAEGDNIKALLRRAAAAQALGKLQEAEADLQRVLQLEPGNKDAEKELQQVRGAGGSS